MTIFKNIHRFFAVVSAALFALCALTGCSRMVGAIFSDDDSGESAPHSPQKVVYGADVIEEEPLAEDAGFADDVPGDAVHLAAPDAIAEGAEDDAVRTSPAPEGKVMEADEVFTANQEDARTVDQSEEDIVGVKTRSFAIPGNYPRICRRFAELVSARHLLRKPLDVSVSVQAWTNYIASLDYERSFFTQGDIDSFEPWRKKMTQDLKNGDLSFAIKVYEVYKQRVKERTDYAAVLLDGEFDFSVDEDYMWKRKDAPWCKDEAELNELWRKRVKNEILAKVISRDFAVSNKTDTAVSTNTLEVAGTADSNSPTNDVDLSPETFVRKRYNQFNIMIQDTDAEWVIERYLLAFCQAYDPHTAYMAPASVDDFNIDMNLSLAGIGATLQSEDGTAKIVEIIPGSPAAHDTRDIRLRKNDKIIGVGQGDGPIEDIVHLPLSKIVKRIRGPKGTKVVLNVISASDPSGNTTRKVDLIRDDIKLEEQAATGRVIKVSSPLPTSDHNEEEGEAAHITPRAFGYVHLPTFYGSMTSNYRDPNYRSCTLDVQKIISRMNPEIDGLILDLRGNGGGSLREAVTLAGSFIKVGPIVTVREVGTTAPLWDNDPSIAFTKPLVVLVDRFSASASEIVAAALQDYGRAVIIGDHKTHGKGTVQTVMPLLAANDSYGSLKVTCSTFHRITGDSTQIKGVEPDIVVPSTLDYLDIGEDKLPNPVPYTKISPARYTMAYPLSPIIPVLRTNAMERLAVDEEYQKHMRVVEHTREVSERTTVPLRYEDRYEQYVFEDKLNRSTGEADDSDVKDGEEKEPEDGIGHDIVLRAAVDVLKDLVSIQGDCAIKEPEADTQDWLYKIFR